MSELGPKETVVIVAAVIAACTSIVSTVSVLYSNWRTRKAAADIESAKNTFALKQLELEQSFRGQVEAFSHASRDVQRTATEAFQREQAQLEKAFRSSLSSFEASARDAQREAGERFNRDQAQQTREFQRALEEVKTTLVSDAELRRAVAQRIVAALDEIVAVGEPLLREAMNGGRADPVRGTIAAHRFLELIRSRQHLLPHHTVEALHAYNHALQKARLDWEERNDVTAVTRASELQREFINLIREALRIEALPAAAEAPESAPPAGVPRDAGK